MNEIRFTVLRLRFFPYSHLLYPLLGPEFHSPLRTRISSLQDPNFNLLRRQLEIGCQAVPVVQDGISQTNWFRPRNATTQYNAADFKERESSSAQFEQISDSLTEFLQSVSVQVEESLQQNETVDLFEAILSGLGEEDMGFGSKSSSNIREIRNFHDVTFTKGKRIESVQWVPDSTQLLAVSCHEALPKVESHVKASISHVLLWSFMDSLAPHASLLAPYDVSDMCWRRMTQVLKMLDVLGEVLIVENS